MEKARLPAREPLLDRNPSRLKTTYQITALSSPDSTVICVQVDFNTLIKLKFSSFDIPSQQNVLTMGTG